MIVYRISSLQLSGRVLVHWHAIRIRVRCEIRPGDDARTATHWTYMTLRACLLRLLMQMMMNATHLSSLSDLRAEQK